MEKEKNDIEKRGKRIRGSILIVLILAILIAGIVSVYAAINDGFGPEFGYDQIEDGGGTTDPPVSTDTPVATDPPVVVTDPPVIVTDPPVVVTDPPVVVTDPPVVVTDPPVVHTCTILPINIAATCTTAGYVGTTQCSCGAGGTGRSIPALGHSESYAYVSDDYETHTVTVTCSRSGCGETLETKTEVHSDDDADNYCDECGQLLMLPTHWNAGVNGGTINGSAAYENATTPNTTATPPAATPVKTGYTFTGWYTAAEGGVLYSESTVTAETTYYAQFVANTYTIEYYGNGATSGATATSTHTYDKAGVLTTNSFTREHTLTLKYNYPNCISDEVSENMLIFMGWSDCPDGNFVKYTDGQSVTNLTSDPNGVIKLYAVWSTLVTTLPQDNNPVGWVARRGYDLLGWATTANATAAEYISTVSVSSDTTLYAVYGENKSQCEVVTNPVGGSVTYPGTFTLSVWAQSGIMGAPVTTPPTPNPDGTITPGETHLTDYGTITYQWEVSKDNGTTWTKIPGATSNKYTTPAADPAGTYQYRCVATAEFDGKVTTDTSDVAIVIVERADGVIEVTDPDDGDEIPEAPDTDGDGKDNPIDEDDDNDGIEDTEDPDKDGDGENDDTDDEDNGTGTDSSDNGWIGGYVIYKVGSGEDIFANLGCNPGATLSAVSSDESKVKARVEGSQLILNPVGETKNVGVKITVKTTNDVNSNYNDAEFVIYAFASAGPEISNPVTGALKQPYLDPDDATNGDVTATFKVHDYMGDIDSNYKVESVRAYMITEAGIEIEMAVTPHNNEQYSFVIKENGKYVLEATDTLGNPARRSNEFVIDYIDKEPPVINDIGGIAFNSGNGKISVLILAEDNVTPTSGLQYCWDYVEGSANNNWTTSSTMEFLANTELVVAVRDAVGNISTEEYTVSMTVFDDGPGGGGGSSSVLDIVYNDISGTIFGEDAYLKDGVVSDYEGGGYVFTFKVTPSNNTNYIGGYLTLNGSDFSVEWYKDKECTIPFGTELVNEPAYGKVVLTPDKVTANGTSRNASADLYLTQYSDANKEGKVSTEKYSMPCSVDVTPPAISATYDPYTRKVTLVAKDALSGISKPIVYTVGGTDGECQPSATIDYPTDPNDNNTFTITFTAEDRLGNIASKSFTFTPYADNNNGGGDGGGNVGGDPDGGSGSDDDNNDDSNVNVYGYKSRMFTIYIINGSRSNTSVGSIRK